MKLLFIVGNILVGAHQGFAQYYLYIGGSTLLTSAYQPIEKEKVQAFHDFFVFGAISLSGLSAGGLLKYWGWQGINLSVVPLLLIALLSIILYDIQRRRPTNRK